MCRTHLVVGGGGGCDALLDLPALLLLGLVAGDGASGLHHGALDLLAHADVGAGLLVPRGLGHDGLLLVDDRLDVVLLVDDLGVLVHDVLLHHGGVVDDDGASAGLGLVGVGVGGGHVGVLGVVVDCLLRLLFFLMNPH